MYKPQSYLIHCQSNLHAGRGDSGYGIIDKMVQRDPVTDLPCIYASSLKGAFREYFEEGPEQEALSPLAAGIFGKRADDDSEDGKSKGNVIFHEAMLIGIPVRSNKKPFYIATSKEQLLAWVDKSTLLGIDVSKLKQEIDALPVIGKDAPKVAGALIPALVIEDHDEVGAVQCNIAALATVLGNDVVLMHHDDFKETCNDYNLPVIARNNLENGESKNLWYEQIVPHQARFIFYTVSIGEDRFSPAVGGKVVQIGANSSLGYGYCKIVKL